MITMTCPFIDFAEVSDCPYIDEGICYNFEKSADQGDAWCTMMIEFALYQIDLEAEDNARMAMHPAT